MSNESSESEVIEPLVMKVVLNIDDNTSNRLIISTIIKNRFPDMIVLDGDNGQQAVDLFKATIESGYEVYAIFMDLMMPVMDGDIAVTKICQYLKETTGKTAREIGHEKIFMVTADTNYKGKIPCEGCESCARKVFHKPINLKKLIEIVS